VRAFLITVALTLAALAPAAHATDVTVVGTSPPNRAIIMINGSGPHVISTDHPVGDVRLISADSDSAELVIDGHHQTVRLGQYHGSSNDASRARVELTENGRGHFVAQGSINGATFSFIVDTGATLVVLNASDALRAGVDYHKGELMMAATANGPAQFHLVTLDTIKVGQIELHNVKAAVGEGNLTTGPLLGMSFLERTNMEREGSTMVLTRRY
jgi:aspartyl protease family protein